MSLKDITIKPEYRSPSDSVARDFFIPALAQSVRYHRAVGFFSSTALVEISRGLAAFAENGGKMLLVASPKLTGEDIEAISRGYSERDKILKDSLCRELKSPCNNEESARLNLLANLIADGVLDIRIAFTENESGIGIYHEKMGLLVDDEGNRIAFSGSLNETKTAMAFNYESIDVFRSWDDPEDRVTFKESAFEAIWSNFEPAITTIPFPDINREIIEKYKIEPPDYSLDKNFEIAPITSTWINKKPERALKLPEQFKGFYDYQEQAIANWQKSGYRGLFDMATGTGKTFTGFGALMKAYKNSDGRLAVFIVCPYQHLVEQWAEDADYFGIKPIIAHSGSAQRDWKKRLTNAIFDQSHGVLNSDFFCCICTNATYSSDFIQSQIAKIKNHALLIADEVHNMGSSSYKKGLVQTFDYRLGLSATIERHRDEEGTQEIFAYFGEKCIEYPIEQAIDEKKLTPYKYYPHVVTLTTDELANYQSITKELGRHIVGQNKSGSPIFDKTGEMLLLHRARLVAAATNKIGLLSELIEPYRDKQHILVYCGAASMSFDEDDGVSIESSEEKQVDVVTQMLGLRFQMRVSKFTAAEKIDERKILKKKFSDGNLQALVAIKCLDEGVNIPSIRTAFMLASTTNPKEYIQRRGRLLRLDKRHGKDYAEIFDMITLPRSLEEVYGMTEEEREKDLALVNRELARAYEFNRIASNFEHAQPILDTIRKAYRLDEIRSESLEEFK